MFWSTPSIAAVLCLPHVLAAQIPRINGIIGGVPALNSTTTSPILAAIVSDSASAGQLRIVENSGVCGQPLISKRNIQIPYAFSKETTPGVYQASGYGDLTSSQSIWYESSIPQTSSDCLHRFWFFAARKNPNTAPFALWFNGGVSFIFPLLFLCYNQQITAWKF